MRGHRFTPSGACALAPKAFGMLFEVPEVRAPEMRDGVAVVQVHGPLMHHGGGWFFDSYDSVKERVAAALSQKPKALVISIDSPGGLVSGCFDTARDLRAMAQTAGVPLVAYVDGQACSAAYALACAAERIVVPATGCVGSVGVIDSLVDTTAMDASAGVRFAIVASGARKLDGNPHAPISEDAVAEAQARVDSLADLFFELVAETRPGLSTSALRALDGRIAHGADAVRAGLADEVATLDKLLASLAGTNQRANAGAGDGTMNEDEKARAALKAIIDGDGDEKAKSRARKALAAMDDEDDAEAKAKAKAEEEKKAEEAKAAAAKAKAEEPPAPPEKKDEDEETDAKAIALNALKEAHALRAERAAEKEALERKELLAKRPDFDEKTVAFLSKPTTSLAQVRDAVESFPRGPIRIPHNPHAASAQPGATRGEGQGEGGHLPPDEANDLKRQMGLAAPTNQIRNDGTRQVLGVMTPAEARAYSAKNKPSLS